MNRILAASICIAALVGCGDDGAAPTTAPPPATTPAPPAPPPPPPAPEPPATPTGLEVSDSGSDFIEWSWEPVAGALGYVVQASTDETFDDAILGNAETVLFDGLPFTAETSYTAADLEAGATLYVRVAAAAGTPAAPLVGAFTAHVTGMTPAAAPPPEPPATPTGLEVSDSGSDFIEWSWEPVAGALGYVVQASTDEMFDDAILGNAETVLFDGLPFTTETSYTAADLEADTTLYVRVAAAAGTPAAPLVSAFTAHVTGMTPAAAPPPPPPPPEAPATPTDFRVSAETADSITWTWNAVVGAQGYLVQISTDETFEDMFEGDDEYAVRVGTSNTSFTATDLPPGTTLHVRVAAGVLKAATPSLNPEDYLLSAWTTPATGMTVATGGLTAP